MEVCRGDELAFAIGDRGEVNALDLDAVFADDAGPGLHGVECAGGAGSIFNEEEPNLRAVGGEGGLLEVAGEVGELFGGGGGFGPEEDLLLVLVGFVGGAVGEEGEGLAVGRPEGRGVGALGGVADRDELFFGGVRVGDGGEVEGGDVVVGEGPGDESAVGREGDAAGVGVGVGGGGPLRAQAEGEEQEQAGTATQKGHAKAYHREKARVKNAHSDVERQIKQHENALKMALSC